MDGEAGEKAHGAADEAQLTGDGDPHVSLNYIKGFRIKVDMDPYHRSELQSDIWK